MDFNKRNQIIALHEDDELNRYLDGDIHGQECGCINCYVEKGEADE